ncbi:transposase, partial [Pseudodesulfovibrio sp. JC047]|uniref:transposase n=1 Tax=Pseudodesulfovibrio sp. JC047 TaxID=2683199 RepID=UPI0013CFB0A0
MLLSLSVAEPAGIDHWSKAAIAALAIIPLPPGADDYRTSLLDELNYFSAAQRQIDLRLRITSKEQDEARRIAAMRSVPGVGEVVATTFAAEIFRPERFNRSEEVTAYLGLAPVVRQSGL